MADFVAGEPVTNGTHSHSRESSMSSGHSYGQNKENGSTLTNRAARRDSDSSDLSSAQLVLRDGGQLAEESRTDVSGLINPGFHSAKSGGSESSTNVPDIPARQPTVSGSGTARHKTNKTGNTVSSIPEVEMKIPSDGSLASFSTDEMAAFFQSLRLEDRLVSHLHKHGLDGRKFGRLKDTDLDNLQLNNPVIVYFRDRTAPALAKKSKQRIPFVL